MNNHSRSFQKSVFTLILLLVIIGISYVSVKSEGANIIGFATATCIDTDGGLSYTTLGTVTGGMWKTTERAHTLSTDYCNTRTGKIVEYYCSDSTHAFSTTQSCATKVGTDYVCKNGACVLDSDSDGVLDVDDICPGNDDNVDTDSDGTPDGCDTDDDGDGLTDDQEIYGLAGALTDPNDADSDDDGLSDGEELLIYGTNPNNADMDADSLSDYDELLVYGSDPDDPDTDDDGHPDPVEVSFGTDPADATSSPDMDSDSDGLSDVSEGTLGTDRYDSDSDDDGLSDGEEVNTYGTDPTNTDSDGDGFTDAEEISNGSDALDATSFPSTPSEIETGGGGPYYHELFVATSTDGETWSVKDESFVQHASVPDLVLLDQDVGDFNAGTLLTYFVDASDMPAGGQEEIGLMYSTDNGETWSEKEVITIVGSEGQTPVDPSIVQLEDGSLRLYYFDLSTTRSSSGEFVMYAAYSNDGKTFSVEQAVFTSTTLMTDPEVILFNDAWFMYFWMGTIVVATASDGLNFAYVDDTGLVGIPGAAVVNDEVYLYGCSGSVIRATSSDGITFSTEEKVIEMSLCDPAPVFLDDGSFVMIVKGVMET